MNRFKQSAQKGFTVIELLVVLVIIIILLGIVLLTYAGISKRERDIDRKNDIEVLRSELDTYYAKYNRYPSLSQINDNDFRTKYMKDFDKEKLRDPSSDSYQLSAKAAPNVYAYSVTTNDGKDCDNKTDDTMCTRLTLTATYERGGTFIKSGVN